MIDLKLMESDELIPISKESLQKMIIDHEYKVRPIMNDYNMLAIARVDALYWILQGGEKRTYRQIANKITRLREEMIPYQRNSIEYQKRQTMIDMLIKFFDPDLD